MNVRIINNTDNKNIINIGDKFSINNKLFVLNGLKSNFTWSISSSILCQLCHHIMKILFMLPFHRDNFFISFHRTFIHGSKHANRYTLCSILTNHVDWSSSTGVGCVFGFLHEEEISKCLYYIDYTYIRWCCAQYFFIGTAI